MDIAPDVDGTTIAAVARRLAELRPTDRITYEYPGYIEVMSHPAGTFAIGTANGIWALDRWASIKDRGYGEDPLETIPTTLLPDADVETVAQALHARLSEPFLVGRKETMAEAYVVMNGEDLDTRYFIALDEDDGETEGRATAYADLIGGKLYKVTLETTILEAEEVTEDK